MPKIHVSESIQIDAPVERVYQILNDFNHWQIWSPWLILEPGVKVKVSDDAKFYAWEGQRVGSGNMQITGETPHQSIDYDLTFIKPWKSKAKVRFELTSKGEGTEATWFMDSSLPIFLFWMKKQMTAFISMDYKRGLALLKDYAEDGEIHSKLDFKGTSTYPGCTYLGITTTCSIQDVGLQMQEDITKLQDFLCDHEDLVAGPVFSIYHKWDMVNNQIRYTSGVPVENIPENLPTEIVSGQIPETEVYTVRHTGPYAHLGNAWSTLYSMQRNKSFKMNKKVDPFETYLNDPAEVPEKELVTEVHFAIK